MKRFNYNPGIKTIFSRIVCLAVFFLIQAGQASGESLQGKKVNCNYEELQRIVTLSNDRIRFLEKEQSKIPRLVKSAIENILATVMERKVKGLEAELKSELRSLESDLEADVSERIKIIEKNRGEALDNLSESLKDEIILQLLARDMEIATSLSELKDEEVVASQAASNDNYLNGGDIVLKPEELPVYSYQESPQEENRKNILLISQMFEYLDEKDREIASLSERLKSLEAFTVERMNPIKASQNRMME